LPKSPKPDEKDGYQTMHLNAKPKADLDQQKNQYDLLDSLAAQP